MTGTHHHRYAQARRAFIDRLGTAEHLSYVHPQQGPDGEIAMDVGLWDMGTHDKILVISSGTHGIEGYCGSFLQCALLEDSLAARVQDRCALMLIHGVNPHGFAWRRRVNENNVDLNRNFIDHDQPYPVNEGYREISHFLEPQEWQEGTSQEITNHLVSTARQHREDPRWLQAALSGGQYEFPDGQFFGGTEPQWSNLRIRELAQTHLTDRHVVWIDLHTALGAYGTGQCIVELEEGSDASRRAEALWGARVGNMRTSGSVSVHVAGSILNGLEEMLGERVFGTGLEFGTVEGMEVPQALIQDQWLHRYGEVDSEFGRRTKERMMKAFYPDDARWRRSVFQIAQEVVDAVVDEAG